MRLDPAVLEDSNPTWREKFVEVSDKTRQSCFSSSYLTGCLSLKGDGVVEGITPGSPAHVEACGSGEDPGVERGEGGGCLARVPPTPAAHAVGSLVPEVLSELLVEPGGVHQALAVGVQPLVALVQAGVHLGPVQVLGHPCGSSNDGRPLVRPVSVLLHVLGKVGLLQADTVLVYRIYNKSAGGAWPGDGMLTAGQYS